MSSLLGLRSVSSTSSDTRIAFATEGGGSWPEWDRFITLDGKKAYHIGNICGTCAFVFERMAGANHKLSPKQLSSQLREGLSEVDNDVVTAVAAELPAGYYEALLLKCVPRLVIPSKPGDYFFEEQVALWGVDGFWGVPHYTKTEYYRSEVLKMSTGRGLFEFTIPMFPSNYLDTDTVAKYEAALSNGAVPTALALSTLDIKQPADWEGEPEINAHWCLSHYVLDGHHKLYAAAKTKKPITVLSFLAANQGVSTREQVSEAILALKSNPPLVPKLSS